MVEVWHSTFDPVRFLSRVDVDKLIEHNKVFNESQVEILRAPCLICNGKDSPGLLLNDYSYLCKRCFEEISKIRFPEKYERIQRDFLGKCEARRIAQTAFIDSRWSGRVSTIFSILGWLSLVLVLIHFSYIVVPIGILILHVIAKNDYENQIRKWEESYPNLQQPLLKHFHDPEAVLANRDFAILKVFNNWPGYPPFWGYLRDVVLIRDNNRCQVSGCPSRLQLHIHHKIPVSKGGEHVPSNLVALCGFHHALEPDVGHERIWGDIKTRYFTMVHSHLRKNPVSSGFHEVTAHVRRLELIEESEMNEIIGYYGLSCPVCSNDSLETNIDKKVSIICNSCDSAWSGERKLTEETGPRTAEILKITRNIGRWKCRWDMLAERSDSLFRLLEKSEHIKKKKSIRLSKGSSTSLLCPKCSSTMRLIKPSREQKWKAFYGCTKYKITGCRGARKA